MTDPVLEAIAELVFADHLVDIHELELLTRHNWFNAYCDAKGLNFAAVESRLMVAHDDPTQDLKALRQLAPLDQEALLNLLADISVIDNHPDPREIAIIENLSQAFERLIPSTADRLTAAQERTQPIRHLLNQPLKRPSLWVTLLQFLDQVLGKKFVDSIASAVRQSYRIRSWRRSGLFNHKAYRASLEQMQALTSELMPQTLRVLSGCSTELVRLQEEFSTITADEELSDLPPDSRLQLQEQVENVRKRLDLLIQGNLNRIQNDLLAKQRSLHRFCVAAVGRTKAGKSTLLATLVGRDLAAIGDGSQGFTRYNRAYNFFGMRLIDTPGIGAAGGQGQNFKEAEVRDSDVARSIFPETDLVCFVMDNDSTVPCTREMMRDLYDRGKAFIILLNVKAGMQGGPDLFRRRLDSLFAKEGERSIEGNISAIRRDLSNCIGVQGAQAVPIIPIHAKAALKASQTTNLVEAEQWQKLSHIDHFLKELDKLVTEQSWNLRRETLRKNPRLELEEVIDELKRLQQLLNEQARIFADTQTSAKKNVVEIFEDTRTFAQEKIVNLFNPLELAAERFSIRYVKKNGKELQKLWEEEVRAANLADDFEQITNEIKEKLFGRIAELQENIQERLKIQAGTFEFKYSSDFSFNIGFEELLRLSFNTIFVFLGAILSTAGLFTGGITLLIAVALTAIIPSLVNWILPGAEQRRQKAQQELKRQLFKSLTEQKNKIIKELDEALKKQGEEIANSIDKGLGSNRIALLAFSQKIEHCWAQIESQTRTLH